MNLRIPGPTPVPQEVREAGAADMVNHRGPEFAELIARTTAGVKRVYQTEHDVLTLSASGTGGMEAAVVNHVAPGEQVLVVTIGVFGKRFVGLVEAYGGEPIELAFDFGSAADPNQVEEALKRHPDISTILITHNETSTGTTNVVLPEIAKIAQAHDCLLIVDAISSLSSIPVDVDAWGLDVVVSGSQKGWMTAPGLAFVSVNDRAWQKAAANKTPRFYFDLKRAQESLERGQTPWTPTIPVFYQLAHSLDLMFAEGIDNIYERHRRLARKTREGIKGMGLELLAAEGVESDTVTAVKVPEGVDGSQLLKIAREEFGTVFAGGQGSMSGQIFRFGHLGYVTDEDVDAGLKALHGTLERLGHPVGK